MGLNNSFTQSGVIVLRKSGAEKHHKIGINVGIEFEFHGK